MEKKAKKQPKTREAERNVSQCLCMLKGMAVAYALTCVVFLGYGILLTYTDLSEGNVPLVALICTAVSAAIAGFDWAKCAKSRGILWGVLAGAVYGLILLILEAVAGNGLLFSTAKLTMILVAMAGGGIGGILGINMKK